MKVGLMATSFDDFVKRKTQTSAPVDWSVRLNNWRGKLSELNKLVEHFLRDFVASGSIQISKQTTKIVEEAIGSYDVESLIITIGDSKVELRPKGTVLFGGIGRADLIGRSGEVMIVLAPKNADTPAMRILFGDEAESAGSEELNWDNWQWKIATRQPS